MAGLKSSKLLSKHNLVWLLVVLALLLAPQLQKVPQLRSDLYTVTKVVDGDTIEVDMGGSTETIRFIGIDTPETKHPELGEQCYGKEATQNLEAIISDKVQLVADAESTNRDRYDRLLRYVYSSDGTFINLEQVQAGFAFAITGFDHSLMPIFVAAEEVAEFKKRGLWEACEIKLYDSYLGTQVIKPPS